MNTLQERSERYRKVKELVSQIRSDPVRKYTDIKLAHYNNPSAALYCQNDEWLDKLEQIIKEIISDECKHFGIENAEFCKKVN